MPGWVTTIYVLKDVIIGMVAPVMTLVAAGFAWQQAHQTQKRTLRYEFYSKKLDALAATIEGVALTDLRGSEEGFEKKHARILENLEGRMMQYHMAMDELVDQYKIFDEAVHKYFKIRHFLTDDAIEKIEHAYKLALKDIEQEAANVRAVLRKLAAVLSFSNFFYSSVLCELKQTKKKFD